MPDNLVQYPHSEVRDEHSDYGLGDLQARQRRVEWRDLWAWGNAVIVILGLTGAVVSLSASLILKGTTTFYGLGLGLAVRVLVGLVLAFTVHMVYQHLQLRKAQRELSEQQIQAEVFRRLAMFDPLTGLYNRRYAERRLTAELARSERRGHSLVVVLLDLNEFKEINDHDGHPAGDKVLKEFAERLNRSIRGSDLAVRWGGDEFMLLLVDCDLQQLQHVMVRLGPFDVEIRGKQRRVTFAAGWQEYAHGDTVEELIMRADHNLYINKAALKGGARPVPVPLGT